MWIFLATIAVVAVLGYYKQLRPSWTSNVPGKSIEIIVDKKTVKNITVKDGQVVSMVGDSKIVSNVKDNKVKTLLNLQAFKC